MKLADLRDRFKTLRGPAIDQNAPPAEFDYSGKRATHYCKLCHAQWMNHADGSWSLVSAVCGKCCDNEPMGAQIVEMPGLR